MLVHVMCVYSHSVRRICLALLAVTVSVGPAGVTI